jgi:hypothetical protein
MGDLQPQAQDCTTPAERKAAAEAECRAIRSQCQQAVLDLRDATSRLAEFVATGRYRDMGHQSVAEFLAAEFPHLAAMDIPAQERKALAAALDSEGATQKAIAGTLGVSQQTVSVDLGVTKTGNSPRAGIRHGRPRKDDPEQQAADADLGKAVRDYQRGTSETQASVDVVLGAASAVTPTVTTAPAAAPEPPQEAPQPQDIPQAPSAPQGPAQPRTEAALPLHRQPDGSWACGFPCRCPVDLAATRAAHVTSPAPPAVPPGNVPPAPAANGSSGRPSPAPGDWFARLALSLYDYKIAQGATHDSAMATYSGAYRSLTRRPQREAFGVVDEHIPDRDAAAELLARWETEAGVPLTRPEVRV